MNLLIGNSHSNHLAFDNYTHLSCSGGSAKELNNPNSKSN